MISYDEYSLEATAKAVLKFNKSARERYADEESLIDFMRDMARIYIEGEGSTFLGTSGFCLTAFPNHDKSATHVVATVSPSILG